MKKQIKLWKKVLKRKISIPFTHSRSQRPVEIIVQELAEYIDSSDLPPILLSHLQKSQQTLLVSVYNTDLKTKTLVNLNGMEAL